MSNAVTATGILILRGLVVPPATVVITANAVSAPVGALTSVVTFAAPHGLSVGDNVTIAGVTGGTPTINGIWSVVALKRWWGSQ